MAEDTLPTSVNRVEEGLHDLVLKAADLKEGFGISPPLPVEGVANEASALIKDLNDTANEGQASTVLEIAARQVFYKVLDAVVLDQPEAVRIWNLLDVLLYLCELRQTGRAIVWYLVEELVESQTADQCRIIFDYLDARRDRLTQREFQVTHLIILRTCNELLRRLSRAEDAIFCGRVFFFLFQIFPLGEQSSVNLRGEFHTDNVTVFDDGETAVDVADVEMQDAAADALPTESKLAESRASGSTEQLTKEGTGGREFYATFWNLQRDFSMPLRLIDSDDHFTAFKDGLERTISKFGETPVVATKSAAESGRGTKRKRDEADEKIAYQSNYNPKYLTSRELFDLELSDLSFQRHILVQALILLDFLLSLSEQAQKKLDNSGIPRLNASVNYSYTLPEDKRDWIQATRSKIATYLQSGPDGNFYYRMVNTVLARDKNWIWWKIQRCPPIVKDAVTADDYAASISQSRTATTNRRMRAKPMGAMDLNFLSETNETRGLEGLRDPRRFTAPSIEGMVADLSREELDLDFATEEEKAEIKARMDGISWRLVRAAARSSLTRLGQLGNKSIVEVFGPQSTTQGGGEEQIVTDSKTPEVQVA